MHRSLRAPLAVLLLVLAAATAEAVCRPSTISTPAANGYPPMMLAPYPSGMAGPGDIIEIHGESFQQLVPGETAIGFLGIDADENSTMCYVPPTIVSNTLMRVELPHDESTTAVCQYVSGPPPDMFLSDDHILRHGVSMVGMIEIYDAPNWPDLSCMRQASGGPVYGYLPGSAGPPPAPPAPFDPPPSVAGFVKSDTVALLEWEYPSGAGGDADIDGFRVYAHWCQRGFPVGEDCSYESRNPYDHALDGRLDGYFFWQELTCDWSLASDAQRMEGGPCPNAAWVRPLPAHNRAEPFVHDLSTDPASFAGSTVFLGFTAYKAGVGQSNPTIEKLDFPDAPGCAGRIQPPREPEAISVEVTYFTGELRQGLQLLKLTPFPDDTAGAPVEYAGEARAFYDAWQYPIVEPERVPSPGVMPYFHFADSAAIKLRRGRGYGSDSASASRSNVVIDGRFHNDDFYVAAHLWVDPNNPTPSGVYPIAMIAGQAQENVEWTIGMVHEAREKIHVNVTDLSLPNGQTPGHIAGTIRSKLWTVVPRTPALPGMWPDFGSAISNPDFDYFENDVEMRFSTALHDDRCW